MVKIILLLFIATSALANDYAPTKTTPFMKIAGSLNTESIATNKLISVGYQHPLTHLFDYQLEGGYFVDNKANTKTAFFGPSIGITAENANIYTKAFVGPAYVSHTDDHLSTPYEFNTDFEVGVKDKRGTSIGIGYKHMSNAQICDGCSNLGRDFLFVRVGF